MQADVGPFLAIGTLFFFGVVRHILVVALFMHLMAAGGEEEVDIVAVLDHKLGDEVGEADV